MKVRTDVEVVVGAVDKNFQATMGTIAKSTSATHEAMNLLGSRLRSLALSFISLQFAKKVGEYVIEVGKAADKNSDLGRSFAEATTEFRAMKTVADEAIGGLLKGFLPLAIEDFKSLAVVIRGVGEALGIVRQDMGDVLTERLQELTRQIDEANAALSRMRAGQGQPTRGGFVSPSQEDIAGQEEKLRRLRAEFEQVGRRQSRLTAAENPRTQDEITRAFVQSGGLTGDLQGALAGRVPEQVDPAKQKRDAARAEREADREAIKRQRELQEETLRNRDAVTALGDGWKEFGSIITNTAGMAQEAVVQFGTSVANDLSAAIWDAVSGAKSAEEAFKEFALGLVKQLGQIATSYLVASIFKAMFFGGKTVPVPGAAGGALHGGVFGGDGNDEPPMRFHKMAHGGIASGPSLVMYGEGSRREAFVPLQDGKTIPVRIEGGGVSRGDTFIIHAMDGESVVRVLSKYGHVYRGAVHSGVTRNGRDRGVFKEALR